MIPLFPTLFDDELLYSGWSRYAERMRYPYTTEAVDDLFGVPFLKVSIDLPAHLGAFLERLPNPKPYTLDELIDQHTLLPFYAPFLPVERLQIVRQQMYDKGTGIHFRAGISASRVPTPSWLRFCPQCVQDDRQNLGTCYWHRVHQVTGVLVCPIHRCWLENTAIRFNQQRGKTLFISAEQAVHSCSARFLDRTNHDHQHILQIAEDVVWLLQQHIIRFNFESLHPQYDLLLFDKGLASYRGVVRREPLLEAFTNYYPESFLTILGMPLEPINRRNWLARLVADKLTAHHPLRHLLLIRFLGQSAAAFFTKPTMPAPFGSPPWPCFNPVCANYRHDVIKTCKIVFSVNTEQGRPIGVFACSCGFIYTRTGPDRSEKDRWRKTRIQCYGKVLEETLQTEWENPQVTLKQLAQTLKTDTATVKRNATRLELSFERAAGSVTPLLKPAPTSPTSGTPSKQAQIEVHQTTWLKAVQENPTAGVLALKQQYPQAYAALYRYAPQWLKDHTPTTTRRFPSRENTTPIDWTTRDKELIPSIHQATDAIKSAPGRPQRITMNSILIKIGKRGLIRQRYRLPLAMQALAEVIESAEDFAIRRIFYVAEQCRSQSIPLTRARLLNLANAWSFAKEPAVEAAIETALRSGI